MGDYNRCPSCKTPAVLLEHVVTCDRCGHEGVSDSLRRVPGWTRLRDWDLCETCSDALTTFLGVGRGQ